MKFTSPQPMDLHEIEEGSIKLSAGTFYNLNVLGFGKANTIHDVVIFCISVTSLSLLSCV